MSTLYLGSDPCSLADRLADDLERHAKDGDFFQPTTIVVPNRYLRKWLRLYLARRLGVAINLDFQYLEDALWKLLTEVDPSRSDRPETIDENIYRLMVLSVLLEANDPDLAPLRRYLQLQGPGLSRLSCRRAWYLAERLGARIRDYEYSRQDLLIQRWLVGNLGLEGDHIQERAQRAVFHAITREPDGKRALLNRLAEKTFKTFPQYAMELMQANAAPSPPAPLSRRGEGRSVRVVHFFGFTQVSELHARAIAWIGKQLDVRFHHLNVLSSRCTADLRASAEAWRNEAASTDDGRELMRLWGVAGTESLWMTSLLQTEGAFEPTALPIHSSLKATRDTSTLTRFRALMLGVEMPKTRLSQDTSLQIVGCPGAAREIETVYDSIGHNLQSDPTLRQTDIAVLVTDMSKYRAAIEATFERPPRRLQYNLVDFSAVGISMFGQAVLGMLDLALESFTRSGVFDVVLNPCFLARLGAGRDEAMAWLDWAERLGIYQGWDADEKAQQGYARSPFYAWKLGLQRLRLGRFMDVESEDSAHAAKRFGNVIPFADLECGDREQLDAFCRAIEGLLPTLTRLRNVTMSGERWARDLERLVGAFLDVPADRPEEGHVRSELLSALAKLGSWDALHDSTQRPPGLPLALVREYVQTQLEVLAGNRGEYLIGGVSIAELQPMRPVPFAIVYIVGLSEDLFPGSNALSSFDLRGVQRLPGDGRPAEARLYDFLATTLSAQRKLYLLYSNHDLHKDQPLLPAVPLQQLQRFLHQHVLPSAFQPVAVPMHVSDIRYLDSAQQPGYQDVLVQHRDTDRAQAVQTARKENRLSLDPKQETEWESRHAELRKEFTIPAAPSETPTTTVNVTLRELRGFLMLPAQASLRRHLRIEEDDEQTLENDEPLVTDGQTSAALERQTIRQLVIDAAHGEVEQALGTWPNRFAAGYADSQLRSEVPEEAFGAIDQAAIVRDLQERIHGQGGIDTFLREHAGLPFCGPILIGESLTPQGAQMRFPALRLRPDHELPADAAREIRIAGSTEFAWQSPGRLEILIVTASKEVDGRELHAAMLEPALFYLALLANAEPIAEGMSSQRWLIEREFVLHVAHRGGIQKWRYPMGGTTPTEALHYFINLTRDFLDPAQFDLLPFDVIRENKRELLAPCRDGFVTGMPPETYRALLSDAIGERRENAFGQKLPALVEMMHAQVPADALAKVQRRFPLLDRGPARFRTQPLVRKAKRPAPTPPPVKKGDIDA